MTNGSLPKCVGNVPSETTIARTVNVDFLALEIVEVLAPKQPVRRRSNVQRPGPARDRMGNAEFSLARSHGADCSRNRADHASCIKDCHGAKSRAEPAADIPGWGAQTIGSFSLKLVFSTTGIPVLR